MADTTDIEKKSLEAHVELCAERYRFLEEKLETVESTLTSVKADVGKVKDMVSSITEKRNNQLINWGIGIIAFLASTIGYLLTHFVTK
jgi:septation ring formation regulator EzrA